MAIHIFWNNWVARNYIYNNQYNKIKNSQVAEYGRRFQVNSKDSLATAIGVGDMS
jgi:hypothetical protein